MVKFECNCCGQCCKFLGKDGLPLWEWEMAEFEKLAKEQGTVLKFLPHDLFFDKISGFHCCMQYMMQKEPCPFVNNNKCSAYANRPIVCGAFPVGATPLFFSEKQPNKFDFAWCPVFDFDQFYKETGITPDAKPAEFGRNALHKAYLNVFGETYLYALQTDFIKNYIAEIFRNLISTQKIRPKMVPNRSDYTGYTILPIFEFLTHIGFNTREQKEKTIAFLKDTKAIATSLGVDLPK